MARKPRIHFPGAVYHVMLRGNGGDNIFIDDQDRYHLYLLIQEGIERYGHRIHAFCLMDNHVHILVQVGTVSLSRIMQNISFRYTRWMNKRLLRVGHLFQGRYKAILVDEDSYLLQLVSYLHLNPVRVGRVSSPEQYPWSSHAAYLGNEEIPWVTTDSVLAHFSAKVMDARRQFAAYVIDQTGAGHNRTFHGRNQNDSRLLGSDDFVAQVLRETTFEAVIRPDIENIMSIVCELFCVTEQDLKASGKNRLFSEARSYLAWCVLEMSCGNLTELGKLVNRDGSSLSSAATRLKVRAANNSEVMKRMNELSERVAGIAESQA